MKTTVKNTQSKREDKKRVNIAWNSRLFFQIGVIVSLLAVFFIVQTDFEISNPTISVNTSKGIEEPYTIAYELEIEKPTIVAPKKDIVKKPTPVKRAVKSPVFDVKPNSASVIETPIANTDGPVVETPISTKPALETPTTNEGTKTVMNVEFVPVFPGCESLPTNNEKIECMSSKINAFINKNFRKEYLENLNPNETYRIYVNFKIDSNGFISEVVANSHNANLKKEAQRVVNNLPKMKPGKQGDKNVAVMYTVPIVFEIQ
ncbi:energy transducer TonB [Aequorivita marisscotiae]|uniref:Energy transducer TonB n=1 Tax=Aequorivita marisscotiae TaxID=3040348 RepID=A0ABY8L1F6_9FLAO|nr:energy transducer TonB [Aequorivita sp. Ant34-E75]WGF93807.1 energy transducer TonB [Aequorivita sp. Ant34-E75]